MATSAELKEKHRQILNILLTIKKANTDKEVLLLQERISDAVSVMEKEDIEWVENIVGIKALS